ncbi:MAG: hypothetical protein ACRDZ9_07765 [Acidimicrobiales bacterium]
MSRQVRAVRRHLAALENPTRGRGWGRAGPTGQVPPEPEQPSADEARPPGGPPPPPGSVGVRR